MFFDEIKEELKRLFQSRIFHLSIIGLILFAVLIRRIFVLQIVNGSSYSTDFTAKTEISYSISGAKGNIYDRNGVLLAYNELAYTVKICDSGMYEDMDEKNEKLNEVIYKMIHIIEEKGDKVSIDFPLALNFYGEYEFIVEEGEKLRFFRDIFGKTSVSLLSEEEQKSTPDETMEYLRELYGVDEKYDKDDTIKIVYFRNLMKNNSWQRYLEFTVATEVSDETVAAILENSEELTGVSISEGYVRKYVDSIYFAHIIGYTGRVSQDELTSLLEKDDQYEANDIVGKAGIEEAMELYLTGEKGEKKVYVDNVGRVTEVISETKPTRGNDVYLSIDASLQKEIYHEIERQLSTIILSKIITGGDEDKYVYNTYGAISDVFIPINDVYFALIDNNSISLETLSTMPTDTQRNVYNTFIEKQQTVIEDLRTDLNNGEVALKDLSEEMNVYEYYIYQFLLNNGILTNSTMDTDDPTYEAWYDEEISLKEFLTYALSKNWINMSDLTDNEYQSLYEAYDSLLNYIFEELPNDEGFNKKIYKYLVKRGKVTGRQLCTILYEQGVLEYDENMYNRLKNGSISAYDFITKKIKNLEITPAQLALKPCSASVVVTDPVTGELLALVSYPSYDNNMMSGIVDPVYYQQLRNDKSLPLIHRATASLCAPGSTYKINSTIAGVCENVVTINETLPCTGVYEKITPSPHCWLYPGAHGSVNSSRAITASCNNYFYEIGYRLSIDENGDFSNELGAAKLQKYAELLGLATKSGIEIYEAAPRPSTINSVASAIGQGSNNFAPIHLARYVTTIASKGTVYNFSLVSKIVDENSQVVHSYTPNINNYCDFISDNLWDAIYTGMRGVVTPYAFFRGIDSEVAGKTGTAQENSKEPTHALFVSFAPYTAPTVTVTSVIQNGYNSRTAAVLSSEVYRIYYDLERTENIEISGGNQVTD